MNAQEMAQAIRQAKAQNLANRAAVLEVAMPLRLPLPAQTLSAAQIAAGQNQMQFQPNLTGLLVGFLVQVSGTIANTGGSQATRTNLGAANAVDRFQFVDPNNVTRHNSKGYHFALNNSMKAGQGFGGAYANNLPMNMGNVYTVQSLASTVAATNGTAALNMFYYVPVAYSPTDLRGAIMLQLINATTQLTVNLNMTPGYTTGDPLNAIAGGASTVVAWSGNVTVQVTQILYDQLPTQSGQYILPMDDLAHQYMLQDSTYPTPTANVDNTYSYANEREYLSTLTCYDNAGVFNTGSDVNYYGLQYANSLMQWKQNPATIALYVRQQMLGDLPPGFYGFDHRDFTINTANFGNCALVFNPAAVTAGATHWIGWEMFGRSATILQASSNAMNT